MSAGMSAGTSSNIAVVDCGDGVGLSKLGVGEELDDEDDML